MSGVRSRKECDANKDILLWVETGYEDRIDTITEDELWELQSTGKVKDPWDKWYDNPVCPECGSKNVIAF